MMILNFAGVHRTVLQGTQYHGKQTKILAYIAVARFIELVILQGMVERIRVARLRTCPFCTFC